MKKINCLAVKKFSNYTHTLKTCKEECLKDSMKKKREKRSRTTYSLYRLCVYLIYNTENCKNKNVDTDRDKFETYRMNVGL